MKFIENYNVAICYISGPLSTVESINISFRLRNLPLSTKCLIFIISSSGGPLAASQSLIRSVSKIKQERGIKTYSYIISDALSSAFHFALAADKVYSESASCLGNIGATFKYATGNSLKSKLGIIFKTVDSGPFKSEISRISYSEKKPNIRSFVNNVSDIFAREISHYRTQANPVYISSLKDGRIINAFEAIDNLLIDEIGGIPDILEDININFGEKFSLEILPHDMPSQNPITKAFENVLS